MEFIVESFIIKFHYESFCYDVDPILLTID